MPMKKSEPGQVAALLRLMELEIANGRHIPQIV
jgi:hypothetical protein